MADFLIQATLSNLAIAGILALVAWVVQRRFRVAALANLLWAVVLIKMVTPPLFSIPVVELPRVATLDAVAAAPTDKEPAPITGLPERSGSISNAGLLPDTKSGIGGSLSSTSFWISTALVFWIGTSILLGIVSAIRIVRFHRLLVGNCQTDLELTQGPSANVAAQLGLRRPPEVVATGANIAPFVWWLSGRSVIVIPETARHTLTQEDLQMVIAHEMAHIKRGDHWFRWLEWIALVGLWWNPLMWWARAQLRISEEMACDDLVLQATGPEAHRYANSLLNMAELLTSPAIRPPVVASAINSGGNLERRLKMIIADKTWKVSTKLRLTILAVAACLFPLGLVDAQDFEAVERRLGGAVESGELTLKQANLMMDALRKSSQGQPEFQKKRVAEYARDIERAVKQGDLSAAEARQKMMAVREELERREVVEQQVRKDQMVARKQRVERAIMEIKQAVEAGKLSKQDAETKLYELKTKLSGSEGQARTSGEAVEISENKIRYQEIAQKLDMAVEQGQLSKEDAKARLSEIRKKLFEESEKSKPKQDEAAKAVRKERLEAATRKIKAAAEAGEMSMEEAEKRLYEMRQRLSSGEIQKRQEGSRNADLQAREKKFLAATEKLKAAVAAERISAAEAEKTLARLKQELFGKKK